MRRLTCFLFVVGLAAGALAEPGDFRPILREQAKRHPQMEPADCYKLIYQACLGSEHAVNDPAEAKRWLESELAGLGAGPAEPLIESISPDGRIVRVHLRAFVARQGDPAKLLQAFVQTANNFHGSRENLLAAWAQVVELAQAQELPFSAQAAREFGEKMAAAGHPAVHHSKNYNEAAKPAYRVIAREYLAGLVPE